MVNTKACHLTIELQKPKPIYYSGEPIVGVIKFKIAEKVKITEVKCLINGEAHVHFTEKIFQNRAYSTRHFEEREQYIKTSILLYRHEENEPYLDVGDHSYPFKFTLPTSELATSFNHELGKIYYSIIASLKINWYILKFIEKILYF